MIDFRARICQPFLLVTVKGEVGASGDCYQSSRVVMSKGVAGLSIVIQSEYRLTYILFVSTAVTSKTCIYGNGEMSDHGESEMETREEG